jgi:hypothetical protein
MAPVLPEHAQANPGVCGAGRAYRLCVELARRGVVTGYADSEDWGWFVEHIARTGSQFAIRCGNVDGAEDRWLPALRRYGRKVLGRDKPPDAEAAPAIEGMRAPIRSEAAGSDVRWLHGEASDPSGRWSSRASPVRGHCGDAPARRVGRGSRLRRSLAMSLDWCFDLTTVAGRKPRRGLRVLPPRAMRLLRTRPAMPVALRVAPHPGVHGSRRMRRVATAPLFADDAHGAPFSGRDQPGRCKAAAGRTGVVAAPGRGSPARCAAAATRGYRALCLELDWAPSCPSACLPPTAAIRADG